MDKPKLSVIRDVLFDEIWENLKPYIDESTPEELASVFGYKETVNLCNLFDELRQKVKVAKNRCNWR
jgi:hypothetical protein